MLKFTGPGSPHYSLPTSYTFRFVSYVMILMHEQPSTALHFKILMDPVSVPAKGYAASLGDKVHLTSQHFPGDIFSC